MYTLMCALAYGLRGFNLYMAVERDRWIGAPIDPQGRPRPFAAQYKRLLAALERVKFHELRRRAPVRLVVPRALRRLARITHAFGPLTPALFHVAGAGWRETVLERDFGLDAPPVIAAEAYLRAFERSLHARGVPFAYAGGETIDRSTVGAKWIICASTGGLAPHFIDSLHAARKGGARVTIGPRVPELDGSMLPLKSPVDMTGLDLEPLDDLARADILVARRIEKLGLPTWPTDPVDAFVAVHEDEAGAARVVFAMNPTDRDLTVKLSVPGVDALVDAFDGQRITKAGGAFETTVPSRVVRMLVVEG
jgi:beta-galactosidase